MQTTSSSSPPTPLNTASVALALKGRNPATLRTMITSMLSLTSILQSWVDASPQVTLTQTNGVTLFRKRGTLVPMSTDAIWLFTLDIGKVREVVLNMEERKHEYWSILTRHPSDARVAGLKQRVSILYDLFTERARISKDVFSVISGFMGLYNSVDLHQIHQRLQHTDDAIRLSVHKIDATIDFAKKNADNIDVLVKELTTNRDDLKDNDFRLNYQQEWSDLEGWVHKLETVVAAALHHNLSPAMMSLVNVSASWAQFATKLLTADLRPVTTSWQHLFQLHTDLFGSEGTISMAVTVPALSREAITMDLLQWQPRPMLFNDTVWEIQSSQTWLAVDARGQSTIALTSDELNGCTRIADMWVCTMDLVRYSNTGASCLQAIWRHDWQQVSRGCSVTIRPVRDECWPTTKDTFVMTTSRRTPVIIKCDSSAEQTHYAQPGMTLIKLEPNCSALTDSWTTIRGGVDRVDMGSTQISVQALYALDPRFNTSDDWSNHIERPGALPHIATEVEALLDTPTISTWEIVAIAMAGAAIAALLMFIAFAVWRAKTNPMILARAEDTLALSRRLTQVQEHEDDEGPGPDPDVPEPRSRRTATPPPMQGSGLTLTPGRGPFRPFTEAEIQAIGRQLADGASAHSSATHSSMPSLEGSQHNTQ